MAGATIQLYTVGTTGTGSTSTPLLSTTITTDANGEFSITGDYSCSSATLVYLLATGGSAGGGSNSAISIMAALGPCSALSASTTINANELTTVAAVYALAPFMADALHLGATGSSPTGLVNAFSMANALVSTSTGGIAQAPAGATLPVAELNTLADILAACINSGASGYTTSGCATLTAATGATDTANAGLAIAKNPGSPAIVALYSLPPSVSPFQPTLASRPNDFTVAINYAGAELSAPYGLAIDAGGSAWVTNEAGTTVTKAPPFSSSFATSSYSGLLGPRGISIDNSGNVWVANTGANNVRKLTSGGALAGAYSGANISTPVAVANDTSGNVYVADLSNSGLSKITSNGNVLALTSSSLAYPTGVAVDTAGNIVVSNSGTGQLCQYTGSGAFGSCVSDGMLFGATAVSVSDVGTLSMTGSTTGTSVTGAFTLGTSSPSINAVSPQTGGGLVLPTSVAYDSNGYAWLANTGSISEFAGSTALSPATGYGSVNSPYGIAVDPSGNVWTANSGDNSLSIFVGLGAPVVTPLVAQTTQTYWGESGGTKLAGTGCNTGAFFPIPDGSGLWLGNQFDYTSGSNNGQPYPQGTTCDGPNGVAAANRADGIVLDTLSGTQFTLSQQLLAYNATISGEPGALAGTSQAGWQFDSVYDAGAISFNNQYLVSFECQVPTQATVHGTSSCLANYNPATKTLSNIQLVISGYTEPTQTYNWGASVPRLLVFNNNLYMYYTAVHKNITNPNDHVVLDISPYGTQLVTDSNGYYWPAASITTQADGTTIGHMEYSTQTGQVQVWSRRSDTMSNLYAGYRASWVTSNNQIIMMAGLGGTGSGAYTANSTSTTSPLLLPGCTQPGEAEQGCARLVVGISSNPLGDFANNLLDIGQLPTNGLAYTVPVQWNGSNSWSLLTDVFGPYPNGYSELRPAPGTGYPAPGDEAIYVISIGDSTIWPVHFP